MADQGQTPDISYRINTSADNSGLVAHTQAVRDDTRAISEQTKALQENAAATVLTNTGGGLATRPVDVSSKADEAYTIRNQKEYETAVKLHEAYTKLLLSKELIGQQDEALTAKISALDAALSTDRALTIAETIEETQAENNLAAAMNAGAVAAKAEREARDAASLKSQVEVTRQQALAEKELTDAYTKQAQAEVESYTSLSMSASQLDRMAGLTGRVKSGFLGMAGGARELRSALVPLNQMLPGVANQLASQLIYGFNMSTIAITAGAIALRGYFEDAKDFRENLDRFTEGNDGFTRSFEKSEEATRASDAAFAKYEFQLKQTERAQRSVTEQTEALTKQLQTLKTISDSVYKSREAYDKALVESSSADDITKAEQLLAIENKYAEMQRRRNEAEQKFLIEKQQEIALNEKLASQDAERAAKAAQDVARDADAKYARASTDYETAKEKSKPGGEIDKQIEKVTEAIEKVKNDSILYKTTGLVSRQDYYILQQYNLELDSLARKKQEFATIANSLGDVNNPNGVDQTERRKSESDAKLEDLEEKSKTAQQRANEAQSKYAELQSTSEQKHAEEYFDNLYKKADGYLKILDEIKKKGAELTKDNNANPAEIARLKNQQAQVLSELHQTQNALKGNAPTLYSDDKPVSLSDLEHPELNRERNPARPTVAAPTPERPDRNFHPNGVDSELGWGEGSEVSNLLHGIDYQASFGNSGSAAKILQAFVEKHKTEQQLLDSIFFEIASQGKKHQNVLEKLRELQSQMTSATAS